MTVLAGGGQGQPIVFGKQEAISVKRRIDQHQYQEE